LEKNIHALLKASPSLLAKLKQIVSPN